MKAFEPKGDEAPHGQTNTSKDRKKPKSELEEIRLRLRTFYPVRIVEILLKPRMLATKLATISADKKRCVIMTPERSGCQATIWSG